MVDSDFNTLYDVPFFTQHLMLLSTHGISTRKVKMMP